MNRQLFCSIKKDFIEYMRTKRNILFGFTLLFLCGMVFGSTKFLPPLIDSLMENAAHMISNTETIESTLVAFFPNELKANMGILSSDIVIFYGVVIVLSTYNLVVKEIVGGKWIFPLSVGYNPFTLIFSKGIVYGFGAAFPSVIFYNLYYFMGSLYLSPDYELSSAVINSLVLGFAIFSIVYLTIILAAIYKQPIMSAVTMILFVAVAPDIFALFSFGEYLPTNILTYLYRSNFNLGEIILPIVLTIVLEILLTVIAAKKSINIEVAR